MRCQWDKVLAKKPLRSVYTQLFWYMLILDMTFIFCASCNSQRVTEKYVNVSYENDLAIGKSYVQDSIYFIWVWKLQGEPGNYLYAVYDRNIVQIKQRGFFVGKGTIDHYEKPQTICLLARDNMNIEVVLNCSQFPEMLLRGGVAMHI